MAVLDPLRRRRGLRLERGGGEEFLRRRRRVARVPKVERRGEVIVPPEDVREDGALARGVRIARPRELALAPADHPRANRGGHAVENDGVEAEARERRRRARRVPERINLPRDARTRPRVAEPVRLVRFVRFVRFVRRPAPLARPRSQQPLERPEPLLVLRGDELRRREGLVVAHPPAADDVESAFANEPPRQRQPRRRARLGGGPRGEGVRDVRAAGVRDAPPPVRVGGLGRLGRRDDRNAVLARRGRGRRPGLVEPSREEGDVREREPAPRVARERGHHRGVDLRAVRRVVRLERPAPSRVEVRVRDEVHARGRARAVRVRGRAPGVVRAVRRRGVRR